MKSPVSRRTFLRLSSIAMVGLPFRNLPQGTPPAGPILGLGRVTNSSLRVHNQPRFSAKVVEKVFSVDTVLSLYEEKLDGDPGTSQNPVWWRTEAGWVHSSLVQPVRNDLNEPAREVPVAGLLAEVTVPFADAWRNDTGTPQKVYRFYFASTHWVDQVVTDKRNRVWYRVLDDRYQVYYFVLAESLRRVRDDELTPLAPEVADKQIEVNLKAQRLTAFEDGHPVFTTRVSTGRPGTATPTGEFKVERKRPSRHMAATEGNGFDLPGVPWVSYIAWTGVALHGTYWHNDFGTPRSRGCINLTPADARWLYRWTRPAVPTGEDFVQAATGTSVSVIPG